MNQTPLVQSMPAAPPVQPTWPGAVPPVALDASGCLAQDLECRGCGYALRGLPPNSACPECGTAIGRSIYGDLLRFSDPAWVQRIARGVQILVIAFIVGLVGGFAIGGIVVMFIITSGPGANPLVALLPFLVFAVLVSAMNITGYWLATTRDPGRDESEKPFTARALARWLIVAAGIVGIISVPFTMPRMPGGANQLVFVSDPTLHLALQMLMSFLSQALNVGGMVAVLIYAGQLARRVPDDRLAGHTRVVAWGYGGCSVVTIMGSMVALLGQSNPSSATTVVGGLVTLVGGLPVLVFAIWAIVLLFQFRSRLQRAAQQARQTWDSASWQPANA